MRDHEAVAAALIRGETVKDSMMAGGYSEKVARQGKSRIPKSVTAAMARKLSEAKDLGNCFSAEDQEQIVRGHLMLNALKGQDKAVRSLELLGKDKRVGMFTPDQVAGLIVLNAPTSVTVALKPAEENEVI